MIYRVKQGDCMSSIAVASGFFWETLWNLPENATLKATRKNPNVLMVDDQVMIPAMRKKSESRADNARYRFVRKAVPEKLRLKFLDANHQPRAGVDYTIVIDGAARTGKTSVKGELVESIPPDAQTAELILDNDRSKVMTINLGHLNPITEVSGVKARLSNLRFFKGAVDERMDSATAKAISAFQTKYQLAATGEMDDVTRSKLLELHGH